MPARQAANLRSPGDRQKLLMNKLSGMKHTDLVPEEELDCDIIYRRGGANFGDEDFAVFKCPHCGHVYLIEYEVDTVYLDGNDLSRRIGVWDSSFDCTHCNTTVPDDNPWIGPKQHPRFAVTWSELQNSDWHWAVPAETWAKISQ